MEKFVPRTGGRIFASSVRYAMMKVRSTDISTLLWMLLILLLALALLIWWWFDHRIEAIDATIDTIQHQ